MWYDIQDVLHRIRTVRNKQTDELCIPAMPRVETRGSENEEETKV